MSEEKEEKSGEKISPLMWLVILGVVVAVAWKFGAFQWFTPSDGKAAIVSGQATATLSKNGDICVQGLAAAESLTCVGCDAPAKFGDAGPGDIISCWGGRVAYATSALPGKQAVLKLAGNKPPISFTFVEYDKPASLGPAVATTAVAEASPTVQPSPEATQDPTRTGRPVEGFTQVASQASAGQKPAIASASTARGQPVARDYRPVNPPVESVQPTPEPPQWLPVKVELCQDNRPGFDACKRVPAQAVGHWYCVADADLPGYARIDYMKAGSYRYDQLVVQGGFTCGGTRSP